MIRFTTTLFALFAVTQFSFAQPYKTIKQYKPYKWMFGVHWSIIEDDGNPFGKLFDANNSWNLRPYPSKITVDRYIRYGWSMEAAVSYGQYPGSNIVNAEADLSGFILAADIHAKYSFYNLYAPKARWIEPYLTFGGGAAYRSVSSPTFTPTANVGGGLNFWIMESLGIQLASSAKFAFLPKFWNTPGNYLHHSIGIVYRTQDKTSYQYPNDKRRYPWTRDNKRFKPSKGGQ